MRTADPARRVVVTGVGMVSPLANGVRLSWERLVEGRSGIAQIEGLRSQRSASQDRGRDSLRRRLRAASTRPISYPPRTCARWTTSSSMRVCAAVEAVEDSGWTPDDEESLERTGVMIGSGIGGLKTIEAATVLVDEKGPRRLSPFFIPSSLINLASGHVSIRYGFRGPNHSVVTACSTGAHAIGDASHLILRGDADVMVAGGAEAGVLPHRHCRLRSGPRAFHQFQRRAGPCVPPLGRGARRLRDGRGRRRVVVLEEYEHAQEARRHHLRRDHRLRYERRRLPHHRAGARTAPAASAPWPTRSGLPSSTPTRSTTSTRTAPRRRSVTKSSSARSSSFSARTPGGSRCRRPSRRSGICSAPPAAWS